MVPNYVYQVHIVVEVGKKLPDCTCVLVYLLLLNYNNDHARWVLIICSSSSSLDCPFLEGYQRMLYQGGNSKECS